MLERLKCEVLEKERYINLANLPTYYLKIVKIRGF